MRSLALEYYFGSDSLYLAKQVAVPLSLSPENPHLLQASSVNRKGAKLPGPAISDWGALPPLDAEKGKFC